MSTRIKSSYKSSDDIHETAYYVWFPDDEVKGIIQISHGICEHSMRYDEFARCFTESGFVVCSNDHLGHGLSVYDKEEFGYFSEKNGWKNIIKDMYALTTIIKNSYPHVPLYLFGQGAGSIFARAYCTDYAKELKGLVLSGTRAELHSSSILLNAVEKAKGRNGDHYRIQKVSRRIIERYNKKTDTKSTDFDWLTHDKQIVEKYIYDEKCGFTITLNAAENIINVLREVSQEKWYLNLRKDLPILIVSGQYDPVGVYGKSARKIFNKMISHRCDAHIRIYPNSRHELLNDLDKEEVYSDLNIFFSKYING